MQVKSIFVVCTVAGIAVASNAWARATVTDETMHGARHAVHRHHTVHYRNPATASDAPQEQAAPEVKPDPDPEHFNHAVGSDGSH